MFQRAESIADSDSVKIEHCSEGGSLNDTSVGFGKNVTEVLQKRGRIVSGLDAVFVPD